MKFVHSMVLGLFVATTAMASEPILIFEAWDGFSSPDILSSGFTHRVNELPLSGAMFYNPKGWSGHYWPFKEGMINNRWNSAQYGRYDYKSPSRENLLRMSQQDLATLSASEKWDILNSRYDYPLKKLVMSQSPRDSADWEGICHGWAPAAVNHAEPRPITLQNADGIEVPFGSYDVKALLSYAYAYDDTTQAPNVGLRCDFGRWTGGQRACDQDLNAGAFHIILANKLGLDHEGFVADVDRYKEVWNQPIVAYRSEVKSGYVKPRRGAARTAVWEIKLATQLWYVDESEPAWEADYITGANKIVKKDLVYSIEIDASGNVVGGTWESEQRPDFVWHKEKITQFSGLLEGLNDLLND